MKAPMISVSADKLVVVTETYDGGFTVGECLACGKCGWLCGQVYGLPHNGSQKVNALRHTPKCPVGVLLDKQGKWNA